MAKPQTFNPGKLAIFLGDGASPNENFAAPCGLTTRTITFTTQAGEVVTFDCDNPDDAGWKERVAQSRDCQISGTGVLDKNAFPAWRDFGTSGVVKNVRFAVSGDDTGYWKGSFLATNLSLKGDQPSGQKVSLDIALASDGPVVWVDA